MLKKQVFSIFVFNCTPTPKNIITSVTELSDFGFWKRSPIKEYITFISRELITRTNSGERQSVSLEKPEIEMKFTGHCYVTASKLGAVVITQHEYSPRVAHQLVNKAIDETLKVCGNSLPTQDSNINVPALTQLLNTFQDVQQADSIYKLQKELDETKQIMMNTLEKLLIRGERLEDLAEKSQDLSFQSKAFMKKSQDLNRCCTLI